MAGLGKLFGGGKSGGSASEAQQASTATGKQVAAQEIFLMANTDEQPEYPPFQTVAKREGYDLRFYSPYPVVEMQYEQRQEGYAALGSFIDGDNADRARFAYTQPVTMCYPTGVSGAKVMQMLLGSRKGSDGKKAESVAALPAPTDPAIRVSIAGGELIAVSRFEGYITPTAAQAAHTQLMAALKRDGVKLSEEALAGGFRVGQYGAVYQLAGRINEMYVKVAV